MATKKDTRKNDELIHRLVKISSLVHLCAFATEAQRTLHAIDAAAKMSPELNKLLDVYVDGRNEWTCHEDELGIVLRNVAWEVDDVRSCLEQASL